MSTTNVYTNGYDSAEVSVDTYSEAPGEVYVTLSDGSKTVTGVFPISEFARMITKFTGVKA
ncbi:hypothetical protein ACWCPQ_14505 [Nocardia sp. NPDC001965]